MGGNGVPRGSPGNHAGGGGRIGGLWEKPKLTVGVGGVILLPVCRPRSRQLALSSRCSCQPLGVTASHEFPGPVVERPGRGGLLPGGRGRGVLLFLLRASSSSESELSPGSHEAQAHPCRGSMDTCPHRALSGPQPPSALRQTTVWPRALLYGHRSHIPVSFLDQPTEQAQYLQRGPA